MNHSDLRVLQRPGLITLLYSQDDSCTRYAVDLLDNGAYACRLNEMNEEIMKELLFSLAWMSHSAYHSRNVREILEKECPGCDFSQDIDEFKAIVNSESKGD